MLKIIHLCDSLLKSNTGTGVVIPQYALNQAMFANVILINMSNIKADLPKDVIQYGMEDIDSMSINDVRKNLDCDIYIIHTVYSLKVVWFWYKFIRNKSKYVIIPHGSFTKVSYRKSKLKKKLFNFLFLNNIVKESVAIHYLTENELSNSIYQKPKDFIIPNGIDRSMLRNNEGNKKLNYIYIGRLDIYYKGLDMMLECINELHSQNKLPNNFILNLYGPDVDNSVEVLNKYILDHNLTKFVIINDGVFGQEKISLLTKSTYFIQTSRSEGLPLGIIEALSYGLPVLITKSTNLSDIVNSYNCGLSCDTNKEAILNMIVESLDKIDDWDVLSDNSVSCASCFYWEKVSQKCIDKYLELLGGD